MTEIGNKATGGFRKYLGNSAWLMGDSLLTNLFTLVVLAVVARVLGPENYGAYAYVFSLAQLFAVLGQMGLDGLLTRELVNRPDDHPETMGTAGGLRFIGYAIGALGCLVYSLAVPGHTETERWLFVAAFVFILITPGPILLENWFRARVEARYSSMARMAGTLAGGGLKIGAVLLGFGVIWVGFAQTVTILLIFALSLPLFLRRGGPSPRTWRFVGTRARELLSESWMVFLGSMMAVIYLKIDQVMLRWWSGPEAVGVYAIASRMSEVFYFLPAALVTTFFPRLIQLRKSSLEMFEARFQGLLSVLTLLAYATLLGIFLLAPTFLPMIFGAEYAPAVPVLFVHMLSMPFIFMRYAFSRWILIEKFTLFSLISQGLGAASNVALNMLLIPQYGMMGAAVATLISYASAGYLALLCTRRTRPVFFMMTRALLQPWQGLTALRALRKGKAT